MMPPACAILLWSVPSVLLLNGMCPWAFPALLPAPSRAHTRRPTCARTQVISKQEFNSLLGPASMHALGHIAANLSFAAVAISLTHTVKTLEPAFNVLLSRLVLGEATPLPAMLALVPIMVRA